MYLTFFFFFFFSSGSTFYDSAVLFFCFLTSVTSFHVYHADGKPGFGFSTRSSLEWMLRFTDNFQLFHSNKKFIKMTCSPGKEFATDFFSYDSSGYCFFFSDNVYMLTLSSCGLL